MKIHEYQAKDLLRERGIGVPVGSPASDPDEAAAAVAPLIEASGNAVVVVKAQIHAGGRGKGRFLEHPAQGGVAVVTDAIHGGVAAAEAAVREIAERMLGGTLVTAQTGPAGTRVGRVYVEQGIAIADELYLSVVLDRAIGRNVIMASTEGGTEIEEVAARTPERIFREAIDPAVGLLPFQAHGLAWRLGLRGEAATAARRFLAGVADAAVSLDTDMLEINPLVVTEEGGMLALDAKVSFDKNALFRQPTLAPLRDLAEEDPAEVDAATYDLSFIKLDGTIGCLVNGAGLAMATMDTIKQEGGEPANFLDVGGGATTENVTAAFKIIMRDPTVRGIFVNIFGGIMRCDTIANGVVQAVKDVGLEVPLVVRLEGTNVALGRGIIEGAGVEGLVSAGSMRDGARKIVELTA